ncbi:hypothetical protein CPB83DRAFT_63851 [Crepidotus variabilis]|uniref:Uncharacterized protein n=1 Tax=Crepidotus variabilis TaxID=179855 RepID=A0A9P6E5V7_9AGAR|nr:hypothetical protein CPB83DRAFT_63851 [Crepidotus variabilis]
MSPTNSSPKPTTPNELTSTTKKSPSPSTWKETFANGAILSLEVVEQAAKFAPVPYLADAAGSALSIVKIIQDAHDNKGDFQQLAEDATSIVSAIFNSYNKSDNQKEWPGDHLRDVVIDIANTLKEICDFVEARRDKNFILRMINHESDTKDIKAYREKLNLAIRKFGVSSHLEIHEMLQELTKMIVRLSKQIEELKEHENCDTVQNPKKKSADDESSREKAAELKDTETRLDKLRKKEAEFLGEIRQRRERERIRSIIHVEDEDEDIDEGVQPRQRSRSRRSPRSTPDDAISEGLSNLNISPAPPSYEASSSSSHTPSPRSQSHSPHPFNQYGSPPIPQPQQFPFYPNPNGGSPYPQGYYQQPYMTPYGSPYSPPGGYGYPYAGNYTTNVNSGNMTVTNTIGSNNNSSTIINEGRSRSRRTFFKLFLFA